jgi:competence protein ComEA
MKNFMGKWFRNYFGFTRGESRGFIILLFISFLLFSIPQLYSYYLNTKFQNFLAHQSYNSLDSINFALIPIMPALGLPESREDDLKHRLFSFNPNEVQLEELRALGMPSWLVSRIDRYRQSGGSFKVKSDLQRIYHFPDSLYQLLEPYILLPDELPKNTKTLVAEANKKEDKKPFVKKDRIPLSPFDINAADSIQLMQVYGIGAATSKRIISYRSKLGGFVDVAQYEEIWGLSDTVKFQLQQFALVDSTFSPQKININTADKERLQSHPYIQPSTARAIIAYREQHGDFKAVEHLLKIKTLKKEDFDRFQVYLTVE